MFNDTELRSIIATSLTGSMAKRKLLQYKERLSNASPDSIEKPVEKSDPFTDLAAELDAAEKARAQSKNAEPLAESSKDASEADSSPEDTTPEDGAISFTEEPDSLVVPGSGGAEDEEDELDRLLDSPKASVPLREQMANKAAAKKAAAPSPEPEQPKPSKSTESVKPESVKSPVPSRSTGSEKTSKTPPPPESSDSTDRFGKLERTILTSKTKTNLTVPDLPSGMIDDIRHLKQLTRERMKAPKEPKKVESTEPKKPPRHSADLLDALDAVSTKPEPLEPMRPVQSDGVPEPGDAPETIPEPSPPKPQPEPLEASNDQGQVKAAPTIEDDAHAGALFDEFLSEQESRPSDPAPAFARVGALIQRSEQSEPARSGSAQPPESSKPEPVRSDQPMEPLAATRSIREGETQEAIESVSDSDSDADLEAFDAFLKDPNAAQPTPKAAPAQPSEPKPAEPARSAPKPAAPARTSQSPADANAAIDAISKQFEGLLNAMDAMNRELPHPDEPLEPDEPLDTAEPVEETLPQQPSVEQRPEPAQAPYDGSWIDDCESLSDVIDALETAQGSIEEVRSSVALFVVAFSDELASVIKTARSRDELELMLRKALTETIDDAFERTAKHFAQEQESFESEAAAAAESFDRSFKDVRSASKPAPAPEPEQPQIEPDSEEDAEDAVEVARRLHEVYASIEQKSAPGPAPAPRPAPKVQTFTQSMNEIMSGIQGLVEDRDYDAALDRVAKARELLARQIKIRTARGDPIIDETMADYELKSLALDLEILKSRE